MPGARIGYVLVPDCAADAETVYAAVMGAGRALGYVNAPSMFQRVVARCDGETSDLGVYETNRELLYNGLIDAGFSCLKPGGAFYLFPRSLEPDDLAFCERAKQYDLLLVPGSGFGCPGFVRLAYCVSTDMIRRSLPALKSLARNTAERARFQDIKKGL
jgi:aspartate aminotransferase